MFVLCAVEPGHVDACVGAMARRGVPGRRLRPRRVVGLAVMHDCRLSSQSLLKIDMATTSPLTMAEQADVVLKKITHLDIRPTLRSWHRLRMLDTAMNTVSTWTKVSGRLAAFKRSPETDTLLPV